MKRTLLLLLLSMAPFIGKAQEVYRQSATGINTVELSASSDVVVEKGTGNEIILRYQGETKEVERKEEVDARAEGLRAIYSAGVANTDYGFQVEESGGVLRIKDLKPMLQSRSVRLVLPDGVALHLDCGQLGSARIHGLSSEIVANTSVGSIKMTDVTGPVVAHSNAGTIEISFGKLNQDTPTSISSSVGAIDVSIPADTRADVQLRSTMGNVYSNFELEKPREDGLKVIGANREIEGKLNNGGVSLSLKASTGNIYLRKK